MSEQILKSLRAIDLNLLPILRELLYTQNVSKAAERLHMTQPAVSEALGRIRVQFGDDILLRVGRKMVTTPFAKSLQAPLDEILGKIENLTLPSELNFLKDIEHNFVIATGDSVVIALGEKLITYLAEKMPKVHLQFIDLQNFDFTQLKSGEVDLAIIPKAFVEDATLHQLPLYQENFVSICRRGHPKMKEGIKTEELAAIPKLGYKADPKSHLRIPPPPGWQEQLLITQMALLPFLVEKSDSIALIQRHVALQFQQSMAIDLHEIADFSWTADVYAFWGEINHYSSVHKWLRQGLRSLLTPDAGYQILPEDQG